MTRQSPDRIVDAVPTQAPPKRSRETTRADLLYIASPIACYTTSRYDRMLEHAKRAYPDAEQLAARGLYCDSAHWRQTWPQHLKRLTACVFFTDLDGSVGYGVVQELVDCRAKGVPIHLLQDDGSLVPDERLSFKLINGSTDWRRYARVSVKRESRQATKVKATA